MSFGEGHFCYHLCKDLYYLNKWFDMFSYNGEIYLQAQGKSCATEYSKVTQSILTCNQSCEAAAELHLTPLKVPELNVSVQGIKTSEMSCRDCLEIHRCLLTL